MTIVSLQSSHTGVSYLIPLQDSTIDFEKRRNVPVRYDRELVQTTVKAMKRIAEIKQKREHAFWKNRSVVMYSINGGYILIDCCLLEWLSAGTSCVHTGRRSWRRSSPPSSLSNPWQQKKLSKCEKKSKYPRKGVLLLSGKAVQWAWRQTKFLHRIFLYFLIAVFPPSCNIIHVCMKIILSVTYYTKILPVSACMDNRYRMR